MGRKSFTVLRVAGKVKVAEIMGKGVNKSLDDQKTRKCNVLTLWLESDCSKIGFCEHATFVFLNCRHFGCLLCGLGWGEVAVSCKSKNRRREEGWWMIGG